MTQQHLTFLSVPILPRSPEPQELGDSGRGGKSLSLLLPSGTCIANTTTPTLPYSQQREMGAFRVLSPPASVDRMENSAVWAHLPPLAGCWGTSPGRGKWLGAPLSHCGPVPCWEEEGSSLCHATLSWLGVLGKEQMCPGDLSKCLKMGQWQQHCTT